MISLLSSITRQHFDQNSLNAKAYITNSLIVFFLLEGINAVYCVLSVLSFDIKQNYLLGALNLVRFFCESTVPEFTQE